MEFKQLGRSGLTVSEICLGGMTLGNFHSMGLPVAGEAEAVKILDVFEQAKGNFIDTANGIYGDSEVVIGKWLSSKQRSNWVIATKFGFGKEPNHQGLGAKHMKEAIDQSLKRLQTDYVDLYQCHLADPNTPVAETFRTLDELVRVGKVRYVGVSNFRPSHLQKAIDYTKANNLAPIISLQPEYSLVSRASEWDLFDVCSSEGVGVITWSPLGGGILSGKWKREKTESAGSRLEWAAKAGLKQWSHEGQSQQTWDIVDALEKIAKETGHTVAQVAVRWQLEKKVITSPIVGVKTADQLKDNLGSVGWHLTPEQVSTLDKVSEIPNPPYPYNPFVRRGSKF